MLEDYAGSISIHIIERVRFLSPLLFYCWMIVCLESLYITQLIHFSLAHGCHYLHLDKGVCRSDEFLDSCKIYKAEKGGECWDPENQK